MWIFSYCFEKYFSFCSIIHSYNMCSLECGPDSGFEMSFEDSLSNSYLEEDFSKQKQPLTLFLSELLELAPVPSSPWTDHFSSIQHFHLILLLQISLHSSHCFCLSYCHSQSIHPSSPFLPSLFQLFVYPTIPFPIYSFLTACFSLHPPFSVFNHFCFLKYDFSPQSGPIKVPGNIGPLQKFAFYKPDSLPFDAVPAHRPHAHMYGVPLCFHHSQTIHLVRRGLFTIYCKWRDSVQGKWSCASVSAFSHMQQQCFKIILWHWAEATELNISLWFSQVVWERHTHRAVWGKELPRLQQTTTINRQM